MNLVRTWFQDEALNTVTIVFHDFVAVQGRCEIMGTLLSAHDVHCHHWKPTSLGGTDEYSNLRIVHKDVHKLIHASQKETIQKYLSLTGCREQNRLAKVNRWRISAGLEPSD